MSKIVCTIDSTHNRALPDMHLINDLKKESIYRTSRDVNIGLVM